MLLFPSLDTVLTVRIKLEHSVSEIAFLYITVKHAPLRHDRGHISAATKSIPDTSSLYRTSKHRSNI